MDQIFSSARLLPVVPETLQLSIVPQALQLPVVPETLQLSVVPKALQLPVLSVTLAPQLPAPVVVPHTAGAFGALHLPVVPHTAGALTALQLSGVTLLY